MYSRTLFNVDLGQYGRRIAELIRPLSHAVITSPRAMRLGGGGARITEVTSGPLIRCPSSVPDALLGEIAR